MSKHTCQACDGSGVVKSDPYRSVDLDVPDSGTESCTECNGTGRTQNTSETERKKRIAQTRVHNEKPNKT